MLDFDWWRRCLRSAVFFNFQSRQFNITSELNLLNEIDVEF